MGRGIEERQLAAVVVKVIEAKGHHHPIWLERPSVTFKQAHFLVRGIAQYRMIQHSGHWSGFMQCVLNQVRERPLLVYTEAEGYRITQDNETAFASLLGRNICIVTETLGINPVENAIALDHSPWPGLVLEHWVLAPAVQAEGCGLRQRQTLLLSGSGAIPQHLANLQSPL